MPPPPPTLPVSSPLHIHTEPLTPAAFSPFGTAIVTPLEPTQTTIPRTTPLPPPLHPSFQPTPIIANQSTALKYSPISPLTNNYPNDASCSSSSSSSHPQMSLFSCFPHELSHRHDFPVTILERHPYTTQTFCPMGLAAQNTETHYLVIVAPSSSQPAQASSCITGEMIMPVDHPPDLPRLKAFTAHGGQAVTYAPGTWHAPMAVLGRERVDFLVTQFVSGVPDEDCQEVGIADGVVVQLSSSGRGTHKL